MTSPHGIRHSLHIAASGFDEKITLLISSIPGWATPVMTAISFVGLPGVVIGLAVLSAISAWIMSYSKIAYAQMATIFALGINTIIKNIIDRPRPDTLYVENMKIQSFSFPSGHTFGSTVFYGLLAYLAFIYLPQPWNIVTAVLLAILILFVGISRVYLGAHFPSDVVAGWVLGSIFLLIIIKLFKP